MFAMQTKDRAAPIVGKSGIEKGVIVKILHKSTYEGRLATVMDPDFEGRVRSVSSNHFTFYCIYIVLENINRVFSLERRREYQYSVLSNVGENINIVFSRTSERISI